MTTIRLMLLRARLERIGRAIRDYFYREESMGVTDWAVGIFLAFALAHLIFFVIIP
jgi:hypothetical protein